MDRPVIELVAFAARRDHVSAGADMRFLLLQAFPAFERQDAMRPLLDPAIGRVVWADCWPAASPDMPGWAPCELLERDSHGLDCCRPAISSKRPMPDARLRLLSYRKRST